MSGEPEQVERTTEPALRPKKRRQPRSVVERERPLDAALKKVADPDKTVRRLGFVQPEQWYEGLENAFKLGATETFIRSLATKSVAFFRAMRPADFRHMARRTLEIAHNAELPTSERLRALKMLLRPLQHASLLIPRMLKYNDQIILQQLRRLMRAYLDEIGVPGFKKAAQLMMELADQPDCSVDTRLLTIQTTLESVTKMYATVTDARAALVEHVQRAKPTIDTGGDARAAAECAAWIEKRKAESAG